MEHPVFGLFAENDRGSSFRLFTHPVRVIAAASAAEVLPAIREVESAVDGGFHAAGFITYEAAPGLDPSLVTCEAGDRPLLGFGLFRDSRVIDMSGVEEVLAVGTVDQQPPEMQWTPLVSQASYNRSIRTIKDHLIRGNAYQVNLTFKMLALYDKKMKNNIYRRFLKYYNICSVIFKFSEFECVSFSPELFFELHGTRLWSKPMKGTARRGLTTDEDEENARLLQNSEKNRAENLMILDMIRNDMGKVAEPGSVVVPALFEVETHPTVLQMTSTVECRTAAGFAEIMGALFPCASVTGAPKVRTMQIINQLEGRPRGVYTGAMGFLLPKRRARFNVAIRTVEFHETTGRAEYGVGSGIVWDSTADEEYEECVLKAEILTVEEPEFDLLETILWETDGGFFLLDDHLRRVQRSAVYFGFQLRVGELRHQLRRMEASFPDSDLRVRVLVSRCGRWRVETHPLPRETRERPLVIGFARHAVRSDNVFLRHKTTHRRVYEEAGKDLPYDDVILFNERNEITETTTANIVMRRGTELVTPSFKSGLLSGVFRNYLIDKNKIKEDCIKMEEIKNIESLFLINSVRKWMPAVVECGGGGIEPS